MAPESTPITTAINEQVALKSLVGQNGPSSQHQFKNRTDFVEFVIFRDGSRGIETDESTDSPHFWHQSVESMTFRLDSSISTFDRIVLSLDRTKRSDDKNYEKHSCFAFYRRNNSL